MVADPADIPETDRLPPMTRYVLGLYRRVPDRVPIPDPETDRIQEGHLAKIRHLMERGELITAGPFEEDTEFRGVMIFTTGSVDRAQELVKDDPAIVHGRLFLDLYTWYGPAGLQVRPHSAVASPAPP